AVLEAIGSHRRFRGTNGELLAWPTPHFQRLRNPAIPFPDPVLVQAEQSNTSLTYGDQFFLKFLRSVEAGIHPEVEIGRILAEKPSSPHAAPVAGTLTSRSGQREPMTVAALLGFVPNQGDGWAYTRDALRDYFMHILTTIDRGKEPLLPNRPFLD